MKKFKFTQVKEIANALSNVQEEEFNVDFTGSPYGDYEVLCYYSPSDDTIAVRTIGWLATFFHNDASGRETALEYLT